MSYSRKIVSDLTQWKQSVHRKPLVLRGARQVGKTTVVKQFLAQFSQYIELNLERPDHRVFFDNSLAFIEQIQRIFVSENKSWAKRENTLLFIDEI